MLDKLVHLLETTTNGTTSAAADAATRVATSDVTTKSTDYFYGLAALGAGIAMIGAIGSGLGQGFASGKMVEAIGRNPEAAGKIRATFVLGAGIAETASIYSFIVALLLIFTKK